jgi:hypothetical protein
MKILINAFSLRLGGGQTYLTNILKHSPEDKNFKIYLLCDSSLKIDNFPENVYILNHRGFINPLVRACWENIFIPFSDDRGVPTGVPGPKWGVSRVNLRGKNGWGPCVAPCQNGKLFPRI